MFNKPVTIPSGTTIYFDVDDTLVFWQTPKGYEKEEVKFKCNGVISKRVPNKHNIELLKKMYESGHIVVVWSKSGVRWAEAVVKSLKLTKYVHATLSKPTSFVDDNHDPRDWMGSHSYITLEGENLRNKDWKE